MQEAAEKRPRRFRFPLRKSSLDITELYAPRKQRKQLGLLVTFNSDDEGGGQDDEHRHKKRGKWLLWCPVLSIVVVGILTCTVLVLVDDKRNDHPSKEQSAYYSTHQQDMLQLTEQITIACGGDLNSSSSICPLAKRYATITFVAWNKMMGV